MKKILHFFFFSSDSTATIWLHWQKKPVLAATIIKRVLLFQEKITGKILFTYLIHTTKSQLTSLQNAFDLYIYKKDLDENLYFFTKNKMLRKCSMSRIFMHTFVGFKRKRISKYRFDESLCVKVGDQKVKKNSKLLQYFHLYPYEKTYILFHYSFFKKKHFLADYYLKNTY